MISFNLYKIAPILHAMHVGLDSVIHSVSIDSRVIDKECMFIALIGKHFDGHDFIEQAVNSGAKALLLNRYISVDVPQLIVSDTHYALILLAAWVRKQVSAKVIAITGSSGKTSVKEMTVSILKQCGQVTATHGNYNNLIGVSKTLLRLTKKDNFAVIELGSNQPGEIIQLSKVIAADVALVNNIFPSHLLGFGSLSKVKKEKGEIFFGVPLYGRGIINADNHALYLWCSMLLRKSIWRFSLFTKIGVEFCATDIVLNNNGVKFILHSPYGISSVDLTMLGRHNVANALAASALACSVGATLTEIISGLANVKTLPGRLRSIMISPGKLLIDDTYNSNVGSMTAAIHVLNAMPGFRVLVISDMLELGEIQSIKYHSDIGQLISTTNIHYVLTVGNFSYFISKRCNRGKHFSDKIKLITFLRIIISQYDLVTVLVKGSRAFKMEQIIDSINQDNKDVVLVNR